MNRASRALPWLQADTVGGGVRYYKEHVRLFDPRKSPMGGPPNQMPLENAFLHSDTGSETFLRRPWMSVNWSRTNLILSVASRCRARRFPPCPCFLMRSYLLNPFYRIKNKPEKVGRNFQIRV
jgi:hypothetical protein